MATHVQNVAKHTSSVHLIWLVNFRPHIKLVRFGALAIDNIRSIILHDLFVTTMARRPVVCHIEHRPYSYLHTNEVPRVIYDVPGVLVWLPCNFGVWAPSW